MIDFDYLLSKVGHLGAYQVVMILMLYYYGIPCGINAISSVFIQYQPEYRCNVPPIDNKTLFNLTEEEVLQLTSPFDGEDGEYNRCKRYNYDPEVCYEPGNLSCVENHNDSMPCDDGYYYDRSLFTETVVTEFDLVCENQIYTAIATSSYLFGVTVGSLLWGHISDKFGRKPTMIISAIGAFIGIVGTSLSHSYWMFVLTRLFNSIVGYGTWLCAFVLAMEIIGPEWRTRVGITFQCTFPVGFIVLSGIAYVCRDWHNMEWATIIVALPFGIFMFLLPESPRWLFTVGKNEAGRRITENMAKWNKVVLTEEMWLEAERIGNEKEEVKRKAEAESKTYSSADLFRKPGIRWLTFKVMFNWIVNSFVYYGVLLNVGAISGDIFINNILGAVLEMGGYITCILLMDYTGRRILLSAAMLICGVTLCSCAVVNEYSEGNKSLEDFGAALSFIGRMAIAGSFSVIFNFTAELYPTVVRSNALGVSSAAASIGGILSPFAIVLQYSVPWLPNSIFGATAIIGGLLALSFPETNGMEMMDTLDEAEAFYTGKDFSANDQKSNQNRHSDVECYVNAGFSDETETPV